ncbi:hypothetical protein EL540_05755 [Enterococcus faecalis]|uniref:hypothetical protein n=1 Tax=Enterococcus faecalis TaxID=1351 RepID=UPI00115EDFC0|nr:hypothetical protein [Enterococcus faecalis]EGO2645604.1 hypothetical protein [Enterococcus faecalis]EGO8255334.1 hypothetical protein [Enterococcus faecalis]EGO8513421.1 hypothetical protein [Enterococcus faecalis]MDH5131389.1 hypothetical protein [Enterococcus faecalis]MDV3005466.1 hypothetical protein [Enterococcus faecalis]
MNDKIQSLLMGLANECQKEKVNLACVAIDSEVEGAEVILAGSLPGQAIAINQLLENFKEEALSHDCDCPQCKQIKESFIDVEPPSTKQNNEKKLDALLKDFLRGEL